MPSLCDVEQQRMPASLPPTKHYIFLFMSPEITGSMTDVLPASLLLYLKQTCHLLSLQCESIPGMGFRRGSYRCVCQRGFYFPNATVGGQKYFNGSMLEEEYEKQMKASGREIDIDSFLFCAASDFVSISHPGEINF